MKIKKQLKRLMRYIQRFDYKQQGFLVYLLLLTFCILLFPLVSTVGNDSESFWLISGSFYKSSLIVLLMLAVLLIRNFSAQGRRFVRVLLGFKDNAQLLNAFALFVIVAVYLTLGETIAFASPQSQFIALGSIGYFGVFFLLIGGLIYSGWLSMGQAKDVKHDTIVADNTSAFPPFPHDNDEMETLFERMKDEEDESTKRNDDLSDDYEDIDQEDESDDSEDEVEEDEREQKQSLYKKRSS